MQLCPKFPFRPATTKPREAPTASFRPVMAKARFYNPASGIWPDGCQDCILPLQAK